MERTEIVSLYKNTPADGTVVTVCGWAKNIRDSKNIGFIALSDGGCFKTLQVVLEAGKLANYDAGRPHRPVQQPACRGPHRADPAGKAALSS